MRSLFLLLIGLAACGRTSLAEEIHRQDITSRVRVTATREIDEILMGNISYPVPGDLSIQVRGPDSLQPRHRYVTSIAFGGTTVPVHSYETIVHPLITRSRPVFQIVQAQEMKGDIYLLFFEDGDSKVLRVRSRKNQAPLVHSAVSPLHFDAGQPVIVDKEGALFLTMRLDDRIRFSLDSLQWEATSAVPKQAR